MKKNPVIISLAILVIAVLAVVALFFFKGKGTSPAESMPSLGSTENQDALTAPNANSQTPTQNTTAASAGAETSSTATAPTMVPTGMTLFSKLGIQIPYPVDYTFSSLPEGNLASPTCTKDGVDTVTGAKCDYIVPNKGSEIITFKGNGNTETVNIITSDTSGYNANACQSMAGTSSPSLNVGGKTVYHTTSGTSEEYCLVTPTYTFTLNRNISTTPEIDVSKILFL